MAREFELCRWPGDEARGLKYCGRPIARGCALDFCPDHMARLPLWPVDDDLMALALSACNGCDVVGGERNEAGYCSSCAQTGLGVAGHGQNRPGPCPMDSKSMFPMPCTCADEHQQVEELEERRYADREAERQAEAQELPQ